MSTGERTTDGRAAAIGALTATLNAGLAEDEALARQAAQVAGPDWTWKTEVPEGCDYPTDYITSPDGTLLLDTMGGIEGEAPHVARHDPARKFRDVKAGRDLLAAILAEEHHDWRGVSACRKALFAEEECNCGRDARVGRLLRILASAYEEGEQW